MNRKKIDARYKTAYADAKKLVPLLTKREHTLARAFLAYVVDIRTPKKMHTMPAPDLAMYSAYLEGVVQGLTLVLDGTEIRKDF